MGWQIATIIVYIICAAAVVLLLMKTWKNFKFRKELERREDRVSPVVEVASGDASEAKSDKIVEDKNTENE